MKRVLYGSLPLLFAVAACSLVLVGAAQARPGIEIARDDLMVLKNWKKTGRIEDLPQNPSHLPKPGYILYLGLSMPHAGQVRGEARRFLIINALWVIGGVACAAGALRRASGWSAMLAFLVATFFHFPLRDVGDYIGSESMGAGLGLAFCGALALIPSRGWKAYVSLGAASALILLVRPNLGWGLLAVSLLVLAVRWQRFWSRAAALLAGFAVAVLLLTIVGRLTQLPLNPIGVNTSKAFLWGTADYYWPPDVGGWPVGQTAAETQRLQIQKAKSRWISSVRDWNRDTTRSLLWRLTHPILSSDQLPPRWEWSAYSVLDKLLRKAWWLIGSLVLLASCAAVMGGSGAWRFVPLFLLFWCSAQALVFGADPRLALPFFPLIFFALAASLPTLRIRPAQWTALAPVVVFIFMVLRIAPDAATSDYAIVQGPGHVIAQTLSARHFSSRSNIATIHLRLLRPDTFPLGVQIAANGHQVARRDPVDPASFPAFFAFSVAGPALEEARRDGLRLEIKSLGDERAARAFLYYPVIPWPLDGVSTIDGLQRLPSGYGGVTAGGIPAWVHPGKDALMRSSGP